MPDRRDRAAAGLRRALTLHRPAVRIVRRQMRRDAARLIDAVQRQDPPDPTDVLSVDEWAFTLADIWILVGEVVWQAKVDELTGRADEDAKQIQQLTALVQQIVREGRPASQIARFLEEQADGIIVRSRRRIHTVLREAGPPSQIREVTRALRRLYQTEWVTTRANRIALDQVLKAVSVFEQAAAEQVSASTGRRYQKVWVSQGDDRVRPSHADADGQRVALGEPFKVGMSLLRYPRDPAGPASETVGCRCWVEHVAAER